MNTPLFSVVIPTFNRSDLVGQAIRSVLKQTFDDFEIVVGDNCSTDDTAGVVRRFTDARLRYVRTPRHAAIADSWEFARSQASGRLIIMLADDDALVPTALQRFAHEMRLRDADFLFCKVAEYRDGGFPGPGRNTLACPGFSGSSRLVSAEEFVQPLFAFRGRFNMHPSAFVFSKALADQVASRCGRFFQTNGVEYYAWPLAAVLAKSIVYIDAPLCICGRTGKSWGSNLRLANPGMERIQEFIADVEQGHKWVPLTNFTICNMWAEGVLTAKKLLPWELGRYEFDEEQYLRETMRELQHRRALGVDVSREMSELSEYVRKYPSLAGELISEKSSRGTSWRWIRSRIADLGLRTLRRRVRAYATMRRLKRGEVGSGFGVSGADFGFSTIGECAEFLERIVAPARS